MSDSEDDDFVHPGWKGNIKREVDEDLKLKNLDVIRDWAVKLSFVKISTCYGSGFFVRIPDTPYDIIFTAAHNLQYSNGVRTTKLQVHYTDPDIRVYDVPDQDVYVCEDYRGPNTPEADYGFIRIPRDTTKPRRGFGFSIPLAYESDFRGSMYLSGFQDETPEGYPILGTGKCRDCHEKLLQYDITTQPGLSGSGVWIAYKDELIAVAIQYALSCPCKPFQDD